MALDKQGERSVFAALVGKPNTGKSTLLNRLVGVRLAIVSAKPQTTRNRVMGVLTKGESQYIFVDTPGFHTPKTRLGQHMQKSVRDAVSGIDCALFVTWAKESFDDEEQRLLDELRAAKTPVILVINKIDTLKIAEKGPASLAALGALYPFCDALLLSALTGAGMNDLMAALDRRAKPGPHLFDDDTLTDLPEKVIVAEYIREKLLTNLSQELPHGCAVAVERFKERDSIEKPLIEIDAEILCEKASHKGMIIGKNGAMLKKIGSEARTDIEDFLGCQVHLQLWVKVREGWRDKETFIRNFGY